VRSLSGPTIPTSFDVSVYFFEVIVMCRYFSTEPVTEPHDKKIAGSCDLCPA